MGWRGGKHERNRGAHFKKSSKLFWRRFEWEFYLLYIQFSPFFLVVFWSFIGRVARYTPSSRSKNTSKIKANLEIHKNSDDFLSPNLHKRRFNEKDLRNLRSCKYFCVLLLLLSRSRATVCPDARQQNDMQRCGLAHHGFVICKLTLFITMDDYHAENNVWYRPKQALALYYLYL